MLLNHEFVIKQLKPKLRHVILLLVIYSMLTIGLFSASLMLKLFFQNNLYNIVVYTVISMFMIIPIYMMITVHILPIRYMIHFIDERSLDDQEIHHVIMKQLGEQVTLNKLSFFKITCLDDNQEQTYFIPKELTINLVMDKTCKVYVSHRYIMGVYDES